jgi:hypothetical protein
MLNMSASNLINSATGKIYDQYIPQGGGVNLSRGQLISAVADGTEVAVPTGANGTFLQADSDPLQLDGLRWVAIPGVTPLAQGQLLSADLAGDATIVTAPNLPAQANWVLTADGSAGAGGTNMLWKPVTGGGGIINANLPLFDDATQTPNKIGINFSASVGEIPYGNGTAQVGALTNTPVAGQILGVNAGVPAWINAGGSGTVTALAPLTEFADGTASKVAIDFTAKGDLVVGAGPQVGGNPVAGVVLPVGTNDMVLTCDSGTTSGLAWKAQGSGSAPIINRSVILSPTVTPIAPPANVNDTMLLVADRPITESWVNNAGLAGDLPPFKASNGAVYTVFGTDIDTGFPFPDNTAPVVGIAINGTLLNWVGFLAGGQSPWPIPSIVSISEFGGFVWLTGGFDTCGTWANPPTPAPAIGPASCIVRFAVASNTIALINDTAGINGVDLTGSPDFPIVWDIISDDQLNEFCWFVGEFNEYSGTGGGGALKNIAWFDLNANQFASPAGIVNFNMGADGPVYTVEIAGDPPNFNPSGIFIGGDFQNVGFNTLIPSPFYAGFGAIGTGLAWTGSATPIQGPVHSLTRSVVDPTYNIIYGAINAGATAGSAYVLRLPPGTYTAITLPGLPSGNSGNGGTNSFISGTLYNNPPSNTTALFDIIATYPGGGGTVTSYRSSTFGTWVYNPLPAGVVSSTGTSGYVGLNYLAGLLYCYTNEAEWKLDQVVSASPLTVIYNITGGGKFLANASVFNTATLNERTSQYFVADGGAQNWVAVGGLVGGLVFA